MSQFFKVGYRLFLIGLMLFSSKAFFAQRPLAEEDLKKMNIHVNKQASDLWDTLTRSGNYSPLMTEFMVDTFRIESIVRAKMEIDYSTQGINQAIYESAMEYDKLMNKFYGRLIQKLSAEDKKTLQSSQRNWLSFRDREKEVIELMGKEEYTGGGTIQSNFTAAIYLELIQNRTIEIWNHLMRISEGY